MEYNLPSTLAADSIDPYGMIERLREDLAAARAQLAEREEALAMETRVSLDYQKQRDQAIAQAEHAIRQAEGLEKVVDAARAEVEALKALLSECVTIRPVPWTPCEKESIRQRIEAALGEG